VTEFVTEEGSSAIEIHNLRSVRGADAIEASYVRLWVRRCKNGEKDTGDSVTG